MPVARYQLPDGRIARFEVPEGTTAEQAQSMMQDFDFSTAEQPKSEQPKPEQSIGRTALEQGMQGATFGFADEITDRLGATIAAARENPVGFAKAIFTGKTPEVSDELNQEILGVRGMSKERMQQQMEQNPATSIAANIGGALLTGGAGATTKAGTAAANMLRTGGTAARIGKGALAGATSGALYGAGASDEGQRLEGAGQGAVLGGLVGGAIPAVGAAVRKPIAKTSEYIGDVFTRKAATASGEIVKEDLSKPLQKVFDRLRADFPDDVEFRKALNSYASTKDKALIQAGGARTANLAEGSAQYPSGGARAVEYFDEVTGAAPEKLKTTLTKTVSPSTNFSDDVDVLLSAGREKATPLYNQAFKSNQSVRSPVIDKILQTPEGKSALSEAVKNIQNEMARVAKPDAELTQMARELADIGMMDAQKGGVASGLKLKTLDYVKKSMDDTIRKAVKAGDDAEVRRITALKNSFVSEIDKADKSGLYARARATSGDYLSAKQAMEDGLKFLTDDVENIPRRLSNMDKAQAQAYKAGVVKTIRNQIDNKYDGQNVARLFNKPATRQKLQSLLSPKDYAKLMDDAKATDDIFKLRNQIIANSRTAQRQIAAEEFAQIGQDVAMDLMTTGGKRTAINSVVSFVRRSFDGLSDKAAKEVADILYTTDPKKKYQIVKSLLNEANSSGAGLRSTEAAKKLQAFYGISDAVSKAKLPTAPLAGGAAAGIAAGTESQAPRAIQPAMQPTMGQPLPPRSDNFDNSVNFVMDIEGGYVADDAGKGETNMGVNKTANPDLDIKNLTPEKAKDVYKKRYWSAIGADKMPPEMALVAFDAAVNHGVGKAKSLIHSAQGDPMKLLQLREMEYARLVKSNPQKYAQYAQGWIDRLRKLQSAIA